MTTSLSPRTRAPRLAAAALGLIVVLGACGGSAGSGTKAADDSNSDAGKTGTPLEQLLGGSSAGMRALEDEIAACMRSRGWQYTPNTAAMSLGLTSSGTMDSSFREQYGYGISTQPPMEALGGVVMGGDDDPNAKYASTLSDADRARYYEDLFGGGGDVAVGSGDASGAIEIEADPNACSTKAQATVAKTYPELGDEFGTRLGELFADMENDPKMQAATKAWAACMAEANFAYTTPMEIFEDLQRRSNEIYGDGEGGAGTRIVGDASAAASLAPADQERLTRLQADERAIAKADDACAKDTIEKVRPELEKEIADKLRSEFPGIGGQS